jgi:hypothetical protein
LKATSSHGNRIQEIDFNNRKEALVISGTRAS